LRNAAVSVKLYVCLADLNAKYFIPTGFILRNGFMLLPIFCSDGAICVVEEEGGVLTLTGFKTLLEFCKGL